MDDKFSNSIIFIFLSLLVYLNWIVFHDYYNPELKISFLNVGQGDMALIRTPSHHTIIIDGGPTKDSIYKIEEKLPFYDRTIDLIILTHSDLDHLNGLLQIVENYRIGGILLTGAKATTNTYLNFLEIIRRKNIPIHLATSDQDFFFSDGVHLDVLYPFKSLKLQEFENLNNSSIVLNLHYKEKKILFLGDIEQEIHPDLIKYQEKLQADIVKISHHGAKNGTTEKLLEVVKPTHAVLSYGVDNKFKHPHKETLDILENLSIKKCETKNNNCEYAY